MVAELPSIPSDSDASLAADPLIPASKAAPAALLGSDDSDDNTSLDDGEGDDPLEGGSDAAISEPDSSELVSSAGLDNAGDSEDEEDAGGLLDIERKAAALDKAR